MKMGSLDAMYVVQVKDWEEGLHYLVQLLPLQVYLLS